MSDKRDYEAHEEQIAPAPVTLNAQPADGAAEGSSSLWRQHRLPAFGLLLSIVALVAVIFVLPRMVTPASEPALSSAPGSPAPQQAAAPTAPSESPWLDAQFAKARREAQDILQKMLEKQEALEKIHVELWAPADYEQASSLAASADSHYQAQEFPEAQQLYEQSLATFESLLTRSESVYEEALSAGETALLEGDSEAARQQFQLAGHIKPEQEAVKKGLERAAVLDQVLAEVDAGAALQRQGQLPAARERYQAALKLDPQSALARKAMTAVDRAIADDNFGRQMSAGFAAMDEGEFQKAIAAFEQALKIRPDAADAASALQQARNENTQQSLQSLLASANAHEAEEEWQSALEAYEQALNVDPNLVAARVGSIRTGTRAKIDKDMSSILAAPERLTTPAVHQDYQAFYREVSAMANPGPKLRQQLEQLDTALRLAVEPVTVQLKSDNFTQVTLYRVGELGNFLQTELQLRPGTYTAVGTREGYRDVRQEFTVSASAPVSPVVIQCVEKISQG